MTTATIATSDPISSMINEEAGAPYLLRNHLPVRAVRPFWSGMPILSSSFSISHQFFREDASVLELARNGLLHLLETQENILIRSLRSSIPGKNVIDLRGRELREMDIEKLSTIARMQGREEHFLLAPPSVHLSLIYDNMRGHHPAAWKRREEEIAKGYYIHDGVGGPYSSINRAGEIPVVTSLFLDPVRPSMPTACDPGSPPTPPEDEGSGSYPAMQPIFEIAPHYYISSVDAHRRESACRPMISWFIPHTPGASSFRIYRNDKEDDASGASLVDEIPQRSTEIWPYTFWLDSNATLPETTTAFFLPADSPHAIYIEREGELSIQQIGITSTEQRWVVELQERLVVAEDAPIFMIKNIGKGKSQYE